MNGSLNNYYNSKSSLEQQQLSHTFHCNDVNNGHYFSWKTVQTNKQNTRMARAGRVNGTPGCLLITLSLKHRNGCLGSCVLELPCSQSAGQRWRQRDSLVGYCGWWTQGHRGQGSPECNLLREPRIKGKPDVMEARAVVEAVLSLPHRLVNRVLCCHSLVRSQ